jgi:methyltransferase (TIGR00027 family)
MESASRTALGAAMHRAAHQLLDAPLVFTDPLALRVIGPGAERSLRSGTAGPRQRPGLRAFVVVRSRFAEDCLAGAIERGVRQYLLLGAGLDTSPYRSGRGDLAVFEVDHPATQAWKRIRLAEAGIAIPAAVRLVSVDFERQSLAGELSAAGFDPARPAFVAWLGVTPYLPGDAVMDTLRFVAGLASGGELVFDYVSAIGGGEAVRQAAGEALAARVAAVGEPFRTDFMPEALAAELGRLGFAEVEDLGPEALNARYLSDRADELHLAGRGRLLRARL